MEPITVAFFGISGSGKGTQCDLLEKHLASHSDRSVARIEMGKLLRNFMQTGSNFANHTKRILEAGGLVPSVIPIFLLAQELNGRSESEHVILDGTCRRPDQSRAADDMMNMWGRTDKRVITLNLSKESAKARLIARGRFDDAKDEVIASRFAWYQEQVVPSIDELKALGWTILEIDGEPDVETIHKNILAALGLTH